MANSDNHRTPPHIALLPSAGMGHLMPFLRLAAVLSSHNCTITLITPTPTVSAAESTHLTTFFSNHPHIHRLHFPIPPFDSSSTPINTDDPFFIRWYQISQSLPLLSPLLSSLSPPLSVVLSDFAASMSFSQLADHLSITYYVVFTSSARVLSLFASLPSLNLGAIEDYVEIQDLPPLPKSSLPPPFFNPKHFFTSFALSNVQSLPKAKGMFLNTFEEFEMETITALNNGRVLSTMKLPHVIPIGPLEPFNVKSGKKSEKGSDYLVWLDDQSDGSVVYVSFGSRTAMSKEQIREIGNGLERSGCAFFWVLKGSKVDKEDKVEIEELLGEGFTERTKSRGVAVKGWVEQEEILSHPAIGGFVSHCGWNSVMEAARHGVPVLAWPIHGDQKVNAEVAETAGLGVWVREWGWGGERLVRGEEVEDKVREMMSDEKLRRKGKEIREEARKAWDQSGSSQKSLMEFIDELKHTNLAIIS
ncbi:UDP-glycosyltransferase 708G1-like [Rhododendron vialii]|uniref:UDP-glycosyltransferase 708G1-like n=1 Tax=Rhododendron vialii TaxID=182163 RepID=UPI00265D7EFD|nr:UDP-glycosyltransferase 708G1-like [Rhododendron vialii]